MAETTEYMKELGVTPALLKKWQEEDDEADEPAPFPTRRAALILAQRRQDAAAPRAIEEELSVGKRQVQRGGARVYTYVTERPAEMTETAEAPVVAKEARAVEEVVVGKTATDRTETVSDTVRRTDMEGEEMRERVRAGRG